MAFLNDLGLDWESRAPLLLRPNKDPRLGPPRLAHLLASDYLARGHVVDQDFSDFYKFAIIRNPWARSVSLYRHLMPDVSFRDFVMKWLPGEFNADINGKFWFVRPQADFVMDGGKLIVDDVFHFESLAQVFPTIARKANLKSPLPHVNKAGARTPERKSIPRELYSMLIPKPRLVYFEEHLDWREYFTAELARSVSMLYASDCEYFGYSQTEYAAR